MKKWFILVVVFASFISCTKSESIFRKTSNPDKSNNKVLSDHSFNATIIGKGLDCGNTYLIKFDSTVQGLPNDKMGYIYYAINLPYAYKVKGKRIKVAFRKPKKDKLMVCTTFGPTYPQIFIVRVLKFEHSY